MRIVITPNPITGDDLRLAGLLKKSPIASRIAQRLSRTAHRVRFASSLAAALLDGLFKACVAFGVWRYSLDSLLSRVVQGLVNNLLDNPSWCTYKRMRFASDSSGNMGFRQIIVGL